jgi:sugar lactone lactonase YvrE
MFQVSKTPICSRYSGFGRRTGGNLSRLCVLIVLGCLALLCDSVGLLGIRTAEAATTLSISDYVLISKRKVSQGEFEYAYRAAVTNSGAAAAYDVKAKGESLNPAIKLHDRELKFQNVPAGGSVLSRDTFTVRKAENTVFSPADLTWRFDQEFGPVADAGLDQTVALGSTVYLDGSASSNPNEDDDHHLSYLWSFVSVPTGSSAAISRSDRVNPSFSADKPGTYTIQLVVSQEGRLSEPDIVRVTTSNSAPVADAGPDQSVPVGATAFLDGSRSSDADNDPLSYQWTLTHQPADSLATLSNPAAVNPSFVVDKPGIYSVQLIVNDGWQDSPAAITLVTTTNTPPVARAGADQSAFVNETVTLDGSASSDVDGDALTYSWSLIGKPADSVASLSDHAAVRPTFTVDKPGVYVAQLIVHDATTDSAPDTTTLTTENSRPVANAGLDQTVPLSSTVLLNGSASTDADGDPLTYQWSLLSKPSGSLSLLSNPGMVDPSFAVDKPGSYVVQLVVNDSKLDSLPATATISTANSRPVAAAGPGQAGWVGQSVAFDGSQSFDADQDPLRFSWSLLSKPAGSQSVMTATDTPAPALIPDRVGDYIAQLIVNDGALDSVPVTTSLTVGNRPPVIANTETVLTAAEGIPFAFQILASDPDGQTLAYSLTTAPQGMTIDASGLIAWAAPVFGSHGLTIQVTDGSGAAVSRSFVVEVSASLVPVPDVISQTQVLASHMLAMANLTVGAVTNGYSNTVPVGSIMAQSPSPLTLAGWMTPVDLVVSVGPSPSAIRLPDLAGQSKNSAIAALQGLSLKAGTVSEAFSETVPAGKVVSQTPLPGSYLDAGATVDLVVSVGAANGGGLPPDPADIAPPPETGVATSVADTTRFLYTGTNPIQTGVVDGTIETKRAAVIRGQVLDRSNVALPGVTITIKDRPEYGQTHSRADGRFDLAVNGGGILTVQYQKAGFLPAQRQVEAPWQDYVAVEDVVLIALDSQVSAVDLTTGVMQVAQGSVSTDADGQRQATVLFPAFTEATMTLPDGSFQPLTSLHVRATEYTVGTNGPQSMPGPLPPTSGYTYAVELSVDEALAAGARQVNFDQAIPVYVDNFRGFAVGEVVPSGWYDRDKAAWIPSENGKVIQILQLANGLAELDTDGDQLVDDAATLNALGITSEEQARLAVLYPAGKTLWRVQITHFTPYDFNWPYGPALDATAPPPPPRDTEEPPPDDDSDECEGCKINPQAQTVGETLPVTGTPYSLNYQSRRVPGYRPARIIDIPLSGASVSASLQRIELHIMVAGKMVSASFPAAPNQVYRYIWDGLDGYGRPVNGRVQATVSVIYWYQSVYYSSRDDLNRSFSLTGIYLSPARSSTPYPVVRTWKKTVSGHRSAMAALGGWNLDVHHTYEPDSQTLTLGTGEELKRGDVLPSITNVASTTHYCAYGDAGLPVIGLPDYVVSSLEFAPDGGLLVATSGYIIRIGSDGTVTTVAGNGQGGFSGDGGPATQAGFNVHDMALGPDGSLYILDYSDYVTHVRRIGPDGIVTTVAGNDQYGYSGDGGSAILASFNYVDGIAVGPDGSLYLSDSNNQRVRRISTDGTVTTVAGNGQGGFSGDGGPANQATLKYPSGLALASDGSLYIADSNNNRIRRVALDGIITTVAGTGQYGFNGDGGPATQATFKYPQSVALGPDGAVYITDSGNDRIRRVDQDGIVTTVAGNGNPFEWGANGTPAPQTAIHRVSGIAFGPDQSMYLAEFSCGIRRVGQGKISKIRLTTGS